MPVIPYTEEGGTSICASELGDDACLGEVCRCASFGCRENELRYSQTFGSKWFSPFEGKGNGTTGFLEVGDLSIKLGSRFPTSRVFPPRSESSSLSSAGLEVLCGPYRVGEPRCRSYSSIAACAFCCKWIMISCIHRSIHSREQVKFRPTRTLSARKPRAAFSNSSHAESSWASADEAMPIDGQRVTIDPRTICSSKSVRALVASQLKITCVPHTKTYESIRTTFVHLVLSVGCEDSA